MTNHLLPPIRHPRSLLQTDYTFILDLRSAYLISRNVPLKAARQTARTEEERQLLTIITALAEKYAQLLEADAGSARGTSLAPDAEPQPDSLLSTGDAATAAGVTSRAIRKAIETEKLRATRTASGQYQIAQADLASWTSHRRP